MAASQVPHSPSIAINYSSGKFCLSLSKVDMFMLYGMTLLVNQLRNYASKKWLYFITIDFHAFCAV
jgi:hypothetical protein